MNLTVTPDENTAIFQSDGEITTACDSSNPAKSRSRHSALTVVVPTPSKNRALFLLGVGTTTVNALCLLLLLAGLLLSQAVVISPSL